MRPLVLIAELTHRCPLRCGYCSNPRALTDRQHELDTATWIDTLHRAAELGVVQVHFTGGEPLVRADLDQLVSAAVDAGLYATLITSGLGAGSPTACHQRLRAAVRAGIRAVQVSLQDTDADAARTIAGRDTLARKIEFARQVRALGVSLTCNFVLHANNLERVPDFIALALELGADRVELAHTQMHGWAALNCKHLLPTRAQLEQVDALLAEAEQQCAAIIELAYVRPDLFADRPSACMGGWGQRAIVIDPAGWALPCHGARTLPLAHENVRDRSLAEIWSGPAFSAFRGQAWMEEPCRSCPARTRDFGGCRCRAFALTGRASAPDPACRDAPDHARVVSLREQTLARPLQLRTPRLRLRDQA